jgi:hypothetical protein
MSSGFGIYVNGSRILAELMPSLYRFIGTDGHAIHRNLVGQQTKIG